MIPTSNTPVDVVDPFNFSQLFSQFLPAAGDPSKVPAAAPYVSGGEVTQRRMILVVDDVADVTEMLSVLLRSAGFEVFTASSAHEAMALAQEHHFDLVISDIGMPEMNGHELAAALRLQPGYEVVPMVAVTGYSMFDDRNRSLAAGFNAHVTKPIDPRAFLDLIQQQL